MAVSLAEIIVLGLLADWLFRRMRMPGLMGMLLVGVLLGPFVLGVLDDSLLVVSPDLRLIALIVILLRAGFELGRRVLEIGPETERDAYDAAQESNEGVSDG